MWKIRKGHHRELSERIKKIREKWREKYKSLFFKNLCQQNCKTHLICLLNRISVYELVFYFKLKSVYIVCIIHYSPSFTLCIQNINNTNCNSKSINCDLSSIRLQVHTTVFNFCTLSLSLSNENSSAHKLLYRTKDYHPGEKNQPISVYDFNISNMFTSFFILIPARWIIHNHDTKRYLPSYEKYHNYNAV